MKAKCFTRIGKSQNDDCEFTDSGYGLSHWLDQLNGAALQSLLHKLTD